MSESNKTRSTTGNLEGFIKIIGRNRALTVREAGAIKKNYTVDEQSDVISALVDQVGFATQPNAKISADTAVYNLLLVLLRCSSDVVVSFAIRHLIAANHRDRIITAIVEVALESVGGEDEQDKAALDLCVVAIGLVADLGVYLARTDRSKDSERLLYSVTTMLLQASGTEDTRIRLCLLYFFGNCAQEVSDISLNRIVRRFGFTVLNQLFDWLYDKKLEKVAMIFLLENIPNLIIKDIIIQEVVHDVFRHNLLKEPEKFMLFIQSLSSHLSEKYPPDDAKRTTFLQHLGVLFKITSDLNHKSLAYHIMSLISQVEDDYKEVIMDKIIGSENIRKNFRNLVQRIRENPEEVDREFRFRLGRKKRGRKPSLPASLDLNTHSQIVLLQQVPAEARKSA